MIYIRDYDYSLGDKLSLKDTSMSSYDSFVLLKDLFAQRNTAFYQPIVYPQSKLLGFNGLPTNYNIATQDDIVCISVVGKTTPYRAVFNKGNDDNQRVYTFNATEDSLVFIPNQGKKLSILKETTDLNPQIYNQICQKEIYDSIKIWFIDTYGLLQSVYLQKGAIEFNYSTTDTFVSFNGELSYELSKVPTRSLTVGDESIQNELKDFMYGFVNSLAYGMVDDNGNMKQISIEGATMTADYFSGLISVTGTLKAKIGDRLI